MLGQMRRNKRPSHVSEARLQGRYLETHLMSNPGLGYQLPRREEDSP